jgi:uncharacterized protein
MNNPPQKEAYKRPTGPRMTLNNNAPATLLNGNDFRYADVIEKSLFNLSDDGNIISMFIPVNYLETKMASLDLDNNQSRYQIRAYKPGMLKVNDETFTSSIIITPNELIEPWQPQTIQELRSELLDPIIQLKPDILLIGTGSTLVFPSVETYGHLINLGIGVEVMDTSAACRTFNALSAENRRVAAALIIN